MRRIEILIDDLTEEQVEKIEEYGEGYGCTFKDYEYISEVWRNGELVAKIHNKESRYDYI